MELKDEQWAVIEPHIPVIPARVVALAVLHVKSWMRYYGFFEPGHPGKTCPIDIRHTKPATAVSRNGTAPVSWTRYRKPWLETSRNAVNWI